MTERLRQPAPTIVEERLDRRLRLPARATRPRFRLSDLWKAPLHDLPVRNEILYENATLAANMDVLEVGPGSGLAAFLLPRQVRSLTVLDYAPQNVEDLSRKLGGIPNLRFRCGDMSDPGVGRALQSQFDCAFALDVLEYVVRPKAFFENMAAMLRPGGRLVVTFPNMPEGEGDGVTRFHTLAELEETVGAGVFTSLEPYSIVLNARGERLYQVFHETPLRVVRRIRRRTMEGNPQVYEQTWAFQKRRLLTPLRPLLNLYWSAVMWGIRRSHPVFERSPLTDRVLRKQILVVAER